MSRPSTKFLLLGKGVYEDLCAECRSEVERVEDFLGVERRRLTPVTWKQAILPLEQEIVNYDTLRRELEGTPWEACFEDG